MLSASVCKSLKIVTKQRRYNFFSENHVKYDYRWTEVQVQTV